MISDGFRDYVERVRVASDILPVVSSWLKVDRSNKAICAFHEESSPSLSLNLKEQYFHCFGCGVGGDVFRFVELIERVPFVESLTLLAERAGISKWSFKEEDRQSLERERRHREILSKAAKYCHTGMPEEIRRYLTEKRALPGETIDRFQLGWADGGLREHLLIHGISDSEAIAAGVQIERDGQPRDFLDRRITFPLFYRGQVVNITGRALGNEKPKYLHLPRPIEHLYNHESVRESTVYVTEGPLDALSLIAWGYPAVAILGISRKVEQTNLFDRVERVYLCLDGDPEARRRALEMGREWGMKARIVRLPESQDPNDLLVAGGRGTFETCVKAALDPVEFQIQEIPEDIDRTRLPDHMGFILPQIAKLEPARREAYLKLLKDRFRLHKPDVEAYRKQLNQAAKKGNDEDEKEASEGVGVPTAVLPDLVDLVEVDGKPAFMFLNSSCQLVVQESVEHEGVRCVPPPREQIPWLLPRADEVLHWFSTDTDPKLFDDLVAYHRAISDLPSDAYYELIVAWDFHTYHLDSVQYSPIFSLFGVPERGKSRTGKGMIHVAYRGLRVESLRDPYIIRVANDLQVTLFFDVMDVWHKAERGNCEDILLNRFERGATVPRVMHPDLGAHRDITYYLVFGPTIMGSNEPVHKILETRSIPIPLHQSQKKFNDDVTPERGLPFRERLVAFRARHLGEDLAEIEKPVSGRLGDILRPLLQIVRLVRPDQENGMRTLFAEIERSRLARKSETLEAQLLDAIWELSNEVMGGLLAVKKITDRVNEGKTSEREKVTYQKVGRCLDALGFRKGKTGRNTAAIHWDNEKTRQLLRTYGLRETPETPETPGLLSRSDLGGGVVDQPPALETGNAEGEHHSETPAGDKTSGVSGVSGVPGHEIYTEISTPDLEDAEWDAFFEYAGKLMDSGVPRAEADVRAWEVVTRSWTGEGAGDTHAPTERDGSS
jgi:DNA primase